MPARAPGEPLLVFSSPSRRNAWLPAQGFSSAGGVWEALLRIIFGEGFVDELALAAAELYHHLRDLTH